MTHRARELGPPASCRQQGAASAVLTLLALLILLFPTTSTAEPLRVLLLDYNAPDEHDVLLSHLCVQRCTTSNNCPPALIRDGVDYFSPDFIVYRPQYLGSALFVIEIYKNKDIDFLSISGHHASGFSGERDRGRFDTESLADQLEGIEGLEPFFTDPALVMLQGCRTDVKSKFDGDPMTYVLHVIDETLVRENEFERLLAAVQQLGGVQQAYRDLFPNACILGYRGTQAPGGRLEIYGQINAFLRGLAGRVENPKIDLRNAYRSDATFRALNQAVEAECPRGWPCNLCAADPAFYRPLTSALVGFLRREQDRVHNTRRTRSASSATRLENHFESSSFYRNSRWSCSAAPPGTPPVWPDPVEESPFGRLFVELLLLELGGLDPVQKALLQRELVHRLGNIRFTELHSTELRVWLQSPDSWERLQSFIHGPLLALSTFRQQDFFAFLANIDCSACLAPILDPKSSPSLLRENAARRLKPSFGPALYRQALRDPDPHVRRAAATRLGPGSSFDLARLALADEDPEVRAAADGLVASIFAGLRRLVVQ